MDKTMRTITRALAFFSIQNRPTTQPSQAERTADSRSEM